MCTCPHTHTRKGLVGLGGCDSVRDGGFLSQVLMEMRWNLIKFWCQHLLLQTLRLPEPTAAFIRLRWGASTVGERSRWLTQ